MANANVSPRPSNEMIVSQSDHVLKVCLELGKDVKACPCKTMVPIYRNHVIAQLKPSTRTRLDLGLALKNTKAPAR